MNSPESPPDFSLEQALMSDGAMRICGIDEAGRGPLAGPVVVAAGMFKNVDAVLTKKLHGLNDSKKLSPEKRAALFEIIITTAHVAISSAPPKIIDRLNIRGATLWAMRQAAASLTPRPDHILIDGRDIPDGLPSPASAIIRGDSKSLSIAAASIIAKQMRDAMCPIMDEDAPHYEFSRHKGYGTAIHLEALSGQGPGKHHRFSFAPVRDAKD